MSVNCRLGVMLTVLCGAITAHGASVTIETVGDKGFCIANDSIGRAVSVEGGRLRTTLIVNKLAGTKAPPLSCNEFELRISDGTHTTGTDVVLTSGDFKFKESKQYVIKDGKGMSFVLENAKHRLTVEVRYELCQGDFYLRKQLIITSGKPVTLERIDVESIALADASQPYKIKAIYARGKWSPGLGQPLYTTKSGTFWGVEFPASYNFVADKTMKCGYLWGRQIKAGEPYKSYKAVVGVSDDPKFNTDAFFAYIDRIRIRPLRLQTQYNTWFDTGRGVKKESFRDSIRTIHKKLVTERGTKPLKAYVIDDGWQDTGKDWTVKAWQGNAKFDADFATSLASVKAADSSLGLWLSPGCLFGASRVVRQYRAKGFEALGSWMSLAGPKYMKLLEDRMVELAGRGVSYFKLDGLFGHLNTRNFELHGEKYGIPHMPQLKLGDMKGGEPALNNAKYDELKTYYLVAGTERLMRIFEKMSKANPDVYIVISNGAYLSSWWLMHIDSVWMINAGDAAGGSSRTKELVYRDGKYHEIWGKENTQFPMHAIFNHEPKKRKTGETKDVFRKYLYMNMSRGTGFIELYIKPAVLGDYDWDVLAEGLHWAQDVFPTFKRSRMHGGAPTGGEVYGYTAWVADRGYVSIHNPSTEAKKYSFTLDRAFGLLPGAGGFNLTSPLADSLEGLGKKYKYGDKVSLELKPREIRILNFDKGAKDWSVLKALQTRTEGPKPPPPPPAPKPIGDHAILGVWEYKLGKTVWTRQFTKDGICTLRRNGKHHWKKPFTVVDEKTVEVPGAGRHVIKDSNTLNIEGKYTARKK
jgi:hypothetical protein